MLVGLDEVGRGAWAGPVVVGAVALGGETLNGLTDSKLLSKKKRELLSIQIKQIAPLVGIGWVSARDIDQIGMSQALKLAARRALAQIDMSRVTQILVDGTIMLIDDPRASTMKKADLLVPSVSAASVIAKVARDHYMYLCDDVFPGYGFSGHVGYGAAAHRAAINELGSLPIHRMSFAPLQLPHIRPNDRNSQVLKNAPIGASDPSVAAKNTTKVGGRAEDAAATYLRSHGYEILQQNWKTKWCEIDIVASRRETVSFVEVKYRRHAMQGGGVAAITPKKLAQMKFAGEFWLHAYGIRNAKLGVVEVTGEDFEVTRWIEDVSS